MSLNEMVGGIGDTRKYWLWAEGQKQFFSMPYPLKEKEKKTSVATKLV